MESPESGLFVDRGVVVGLLIEWWIGELVNGCRRVVESVGGGLLERVATFTDVPLRVRSWFDSVPKRI